MKLPNNAIESASANASHYALPEAKPKLLVVDDQPINIQVLYQIFGSEYQVFMATSGAQALAMCLQNSPDLILLDVVMPGMDGFEVCAQLKSHEQTREIPVIFLTALNDSEQETHGLELGAVDFISKPVNPAVVKARVKTHLVLKQQNDIMRQLAFLDGLTGVYNRRYFDQQLDVEMGRARRNGAPLSLILLDIDFFKRFNDQYGHQAGDECLRMVAAALKNCLRRPADLLARYGGEEFVCILPETDYESAMDLANVMEQRVRALQLVHAGSDAAGVVTISLGVAECNKDATEVANDLLSQADQQLYQAKKSGRGRVNGSLAAHKM
jgi:diguanylate cyclase (GGDEF)-like protein